MKLAVCSLAIMLAACGSSDDEPSDERSSGAIAPPQSPGGIPSATTAVPETSRELKVTGPITGGGGKPEAIAITDFAAAGYSEKEYFIEGQATAYDVTDDQRMDGKWSLSARSQAGYRTRILVRRPNDADRFNGTVVVEWFNVSGGLDADPGYMYNHPLILREGWAWVGVSAQATGVDASSSLSIASLGNLLGMPMPMMTSDGTPMPAPLKQYDPVRYADLLHPGDDYSFDIFTQAARAVRGEGGLDVLEGLQPQRLIAYGESQSAGRMTSYVNGVAPSSKVFDGYFIHSRGASGSVFLMTGNDLFSSFLGGGTPHRIRADLDVPVFQFQTETDVHGMLKYLPARQEDTDKLRTWEVAGTAHADKYLTDLSGGAAIPGSFECPMANDGPQRFVIRAALRSLDRWIAGESTPPHGEPLMLDQTNAPLLDSHGNTLGGVRSPDVDVPIVTLSGTGSTGGDASGGALGAVFCGIFGSTTPLSPQKLVELYPTHEDYVSKVDESGAQAVDHGFLLDEEREEMRARADAAPVPK